MALVTEAKVSESPLILIVDDDWMNLEVMQAYLQLADYRIILAHSGAEALRLAASCAPDLVLVDARMHDMTGYEVCATLRQGDLTRDIPIMIMTALESDDDRQRALKAGADDFVQKSFSSPALLQRIANLLQS
jgi:CheY-like chemotaxis protein